MLTLRVPDVDVESTVTDLYMAYAAPRHAEEMCVACGAVAEHVQQRRLWNSQNVLLMSIDRGSAGVSGQNGVVLVEERFSAPDAGDLDLVGAVYWVGGPAARCISLCRAARAFSIMDDCGGLG